MADKLCPVCGKIARFVTQVGANKVLIRHFSKRYEDCTQEGEGVTSGGGHVEHHATGRALKNEALDEHEIAKVRPIYRCREYLQALYKRRVLALDPGLGRGPDLGDLARVNADDARTFCDVNLITRGPWLGAVFRPKAWVWDGITHSTDPIQHGAMLKQWRYVDG